MVKCGEKDLSGSEILLDVLYFNMLTLWQISGSSSYLLESDIAFFVIPFEKTGKCTAKRMRLLSYFVCVR